MEWSDRPERLTNPFKYLGGKSSLAARIVDVLPPHHTYVEPFCGSAAVLFTKEPSPVEVINDKDGNVANFFLCLKDKTLSVELRHRIMFTPYSRREYYDTVPVLRAPWSGKPDVRRAHAFFVGQNQAYGGLPLLEGKAPPGWGKSVTHKGDAEVCQVISAWLKRLAQMDGYIHRLRNVVVENRDAFEVIREWDSPDTVFYCDPPYVWTARRSGSYTHELEDGEHEKLVDLLLSTQGSVVLSGYPNPIYERLTEAGWQRMEFDTVCRAMGARTPTHRNPERQEARLGRRTEVLWIKHAGAASRPPVVPGLE